MVNRRSLTEGIKPPSSPVPQQVEKAFVYGEKPSAPEVARSTSQPLGKAPISTRIRGDFAAALKRASLQRQLDSVMPNTLQGILEEALEPWLKSNGYI
jgi:hypothetical protein